MYIAMGNVTDIHKCSEHERLLSKNKNYISEDVTFMTVRRLKENSLLYIDPHLSGEMC